MGHHAVAQTASLTLQEVTVTGNPLGRTERVAPTSQVQGDDLTLRANDTRWEKRWAACRSSAARLWPQRAPAHHPWVGRRSHPRAAKQQCQSERVQPELGPRCACRSAEHRAGRGAAWPGRAALPLQRRGQRGQCDRQRQALLDATGSLSGKTELNAAAGDRELERDGGVPVALTCTRPGAQSLTRRLCSSARNTKAALWAARFCSTTATSVPRSRATAAPTAP
jgi:hypothetical protein